MPELADSMIEIRYWFKASIVAIVVFVVAVVALKLAGVEAVTAAGVIGVITLFVGGTISNLKTGVDTRRAIEKADRDREQAALDRVEARQIAAQAALDRELTREHLVKSDQARATEVALVACIAQTAAAEQKVIAEANAQRLTTIQEQGDAAAIVNAATHLLVNSQSELEKEQMVDTKALVVELLKELKRGPDVIAKAEAAQAVAEKKLADHRAKQHEVDLQPGTDAEKSGK